MSIGFIAIVLCALGQIGAKAEFQVYFEDMSIESIDPTYFDVESTDAFIAEGSTNQNTITANLTIVKQIPPEAEGHFTIFGLSMGKYTMATGIDISMALCEMVEEPILMGPFLAVLGFTTESCPPQPGNYFQEGYTLPMENMPDDFPENKYLVIFEIALNGKNLIAIHIYVEVQAQ